jgi:hypothetical protein
MLKLHEEGRYKVVVIDNKTGKAVDTIKFEHNVSGMRWEKVLAKELAVVLNVSGSAKTKFIVYLIENKKDDNQVSGTHAMMAKEAGVSVDMVNRLMPKLKKIGFVKKMCTGVHMINPKTIRPGERLKGQMLVSIWDGVI